MKPFAPDARIVVSDLHLGTGHRRGEFNPYEDFYEDDKFQQLLQHYADLHGRGGGGVELILNGDILDLLKVEMESGERFPDEITEEIAEHKVRRCLAGHRRFCDALSQFLDAGGGRITVLPGNHDIELLLPSAQKAMRDLVAPGSLGGRVHFVDRTPIYSLPEGIQVCHGHEFDAVNQFDYRRLMVRRRGDSAPIINLPWGSVMALHVIIPAKEERYYVDHIHPFSRLLLGGLLFDLRFAARLTGKILYHFFASRFSPKGGSVYQRLWEGLKVIKDQLSPMRGFDRTAERALRRTRGVHTLITGHSHHPRYRQVAPGKLYVNTGTWIKMLNVDLQHLGQDSGLTYALVTYDENRVPRTQLRRWHGSYEVSRMVPY